MKTWYDKEEDILNIQLKEENYWKSIELPSGILIDLTKDGSVMAIEIWNASKIFCGDARKVLERVEVVEGAKQIIS